MLEAASAGEGVTAALELVDSALLASSGGIQQ